MKYAIKANGELVKNRITDKKPMRFYQETDAIECIENLQRHGVLRVAEVVEYNEVTL